MIRISDQKKYNAQKGSAIITVIVFITIILLFISTIFLYNRYRFKQIIKFSDEIQAYHNAASVLSFALNEYLPIFQNKDYYRKTFNYSLFKKDSTTAVIEPWGYFLRARCSSKIHNVIKQRSFLIGSKSANISKYAIVLGNTRNPLIVTGNTSITGDVAVGMQGVKPGVIKGKRYQGKQSVYGNINKNRNSYLPEINFELLDFQRQQFKNLYSKAAPINIDSDNQKLFLKDGIYLLTQEILTQIKKAGVIDIIGPGTIMLDSDIIFTDINLYNQVTLYSNKYIQFLNNVKSDHILVFADRITIDGSSNLRGQFFAENSFSIINIAKLTYPSIAGIISKKIWNKENVFQIGSNVEIQGAVLLANNLAKEIGHKKHKLQIDPHAFINGIVYSDNYTELTGTVYGSVMTDVFHFYLSPTIYINWIKDAEINRLLMNEKFTYPLSFEQDFQLVKIMEM